MEETERNAAPEGGGGIGQAMADPEIAALLEFDPVPRKLKRGNSWTPELQRRFVAGIALTGSRSKAAMALGREVGGASKLCQAPGGKPFADACDAALDLYQARQDAAAAASPGSAWGEPLRSRRRRGREEQTEPLPGQVRNELGDWEDEDSYADRAGTAQSSMCRKLVQIRRLYLQEISACPGKRAAFEILTELPIDWDKAERCEAQADEPWHNANQRKPDMVLTAESGWTFGELGYGPDRKAEARRAMDAYHAEHDLPPIAWECESAED